MSEIPIDICKSFLYSDGINRRDPMTAVSVSVSPAPVEQDKIYVVRIERSGKVWSVSVPMDLAEAQAFLKSANDRRTERLKTTKDAWDRVPQRYFIARINFEEIA
ncbi:hypothetical protein KABACHOK_00540 [Brevundimonas phage vB_BpoS-Kabachok]|uniref:Uncharacterized protein n=1 Tax=Brevundimonas phage vB_BpoS-Kabachok TaxID=2948600 RepID=A0A9E7MNZ0_9CAUD|nr:hypothetical protein KABACHOK_00540 [Brevundimonas phage vB_BpoS-Kabachok]